MRAGSRCVFLVGAGLFMMWESLARGLFIDIVNMYVYCLKV
jgi:hypothetical protein